MNAFWKKLFVATTSVLLLTGSFSARAAPYSIDLNSFAYSYGNTTHLLNFSTAGDFPPGTIDPATGITLIWQAIETPLSSGWINGAWHMSMEQSTASTTATRALSAINGYGEYTGSPPANWQVTATFSNIANADLLGNEYKVRVGVGSDTVGAPGASLNFHWFTGEHDGTYYNHVLFVNSEISVGTYTLESGPVIIQESDLNPMDTLLQASVVVSNDGKTFSSFYKLDSAANWTLAHTYTLPAGAGVLYGFPSSFPYVGIYNYAQAVPELPTSWLLLGGLVSFLVAARSMSQRKDQAPL